MCKCGFKNHENAKYCSNCGNKLTKEQKSKFPSMLTVKEAHEIVFFKKLSLTKIYSLIKTRSLPHVNANGKILLDLEKTIDWWNNELINSTKENKIYGLRKII